MDIEVKNLRFGYGKEDILHDLNCRFDNGEFCAVIGPNGSGKSTFIRLLARLLTPKEGTILLDGKNLENYHRRFLARHIGYVPQSGGNSPMATVFDTVMLGRKPHLHWFPGKEDVRKTEAIMYDLSLSNFAHRLTSELSGGELQRVQIARALVQEPDVLILDEPTSSLDLKHQIEVMNILKGISRKNITVIVAIHDLNLAMRYAERFVLLKYGRIISMGDHSIISEKNIKKLYDVNIQRVEAEGGSYLLPEY